MRSWRSSAAYRIAFANFGIFSIGLAVLGLVVFWAMHVAFTSQLDATISDEAQTLIDEYRAGGDRELKEAIAEREMSHSPTRMLYAVFAPDGRKLSGSLQTARPRLGLHDILFVDPSEGPDPARALAVDITPTQRLVVAADREWIERIDKTVIAVFGVGLRRRLAARLRRRADVRRLFEAAAALDQQRSRSDHRRRHSRTDAGQRAPRRVRPARFDAQPHARSDRGLLENLRQVSSDVAHDLRTPLSRLRNRLEQGASHRPEAASTRRCWRMQSRGSTKSCRCLPPSCASPKSKAARPGVSSPRSI